ncbi:MAG: AI-2E family transporter [Bacteroides sp.]|nr:AI-2E family transporter [Bacteroides sp.]MCM1413088.1 AI-2E family transporter [Bacteroides sp.]MCM1472170.1 AI-2E family transporter [Bacteroides sp.]
MSETKSNTFDRVVRLIVIMVCIIAAILLINKLTDVLLPFFVACLAAYMLEPFVQRNRKMLRLKGRVVAVLVTLFEGIFLLGVLIYFVAPIIMEEMHQMAVVINRYISTELRGGMIPAEVHRFLRQSFDLESLSRSLTKQEWATIAENVLSTSWNLISGSLSLLLSIFNWFIVLLYLVFIMIDYDRLNRSFKAMVPPSWRRPVYTIANDVKASMNHYFRGQATIAFIVGILFAIGFSIIGMPMAIIFGLFIGVLNLVPYLQLVSLVPAVALCVIYSAGGDGDFWSIFCKCIAVYCIVQLIQDLYLTPKIMGKAMGLNPAIILLSLSIWGTLLGFVGLIIALPLTTLLLSYYEHIITGKHRRWRRKEAKAIEEVVKDPIDPD